MPSTSRTAEPDPQPTGSPGWRARLLRQGRALFVLFHIVAVSMAAAPSPAAGMRRAAWSEPTVQREFKAWADRLGQDPATFEDRLWEGASAFMEVRRAVMVPFRPYLDWTGADQAWQMFVAPHRWPTRLHLDVSRQNPPRSEKMWEPLFEERSSEASWHASFFARERVRASVFRWGWPNYVEAYKNGCAGLAKLVFAEKADVRAVRCRFSRVRSPSPAEVRAGQEPRIEWRSTRVEERP